MTELTEAEQKKLNTGRVMRVEADILFPLLKQRRETSISKLIHYFKAGEFDKLASGVAELATLEDMAADINNKIKTAEGLERRIHNGN